MSGRYDYGRGAIIGIGTPQANPTVEAEMRILFEPDILVQSVRLASKAAASNDRLKAYLLDLETTLDRYDSLRPAAFGFGCTGSSYLVHNDEEERLIDRLQQRFGYPIITATAAIKAELAAIDAQRIALASPYPGTLSDAAAAYWRNAGFDVVTVRRIETGITDLGLPSSLAGVLVAMLILAPEALNAIQAASAGEVQRSINTLYGSVVATVSLTVPAVLVLGGITGTDVILGLEPFEMVLLALTLILSYPHARLTGIEGLMKLVIFVFWILLQVA